MSIATEIKYIVRDPSVLGGVPTIEGHRIAVHHIVWWYHQGLAAEQLAQEFSLSLAQIHAALLYYYEHKGEIDQEVEDNDTTFAAQADASASPLSQRMRDLLAQQAAHGS